MTCHDAREWLGALVDDAIDPARRGEVEAHLLACAECRLELEGLRFDAIPTRAGADRA